MLREKLKFQKYINKSFQKRSFNQFIDQFNTQVELE